MELTKNQVARYSRHLIMPEVGPEGQKKLLSASVLMIGAGGLGSPLALYLAAAGVGRIGIVDHDVVDFSNLQRQIIHREADLGRSKVESAKERINSINSDVKVEIYPERLTSENAMEIFKDYDIIIDGTDNFATRYLVNDACVLLGKPNVYGSIFRFEGQVTVFDAKRGPCYRCLYPEPPPPGLVPSCAEGGVLGILPGVVGTMQAAEGIKLILGKGNSLIGRLLVMNVLDMEIRELKLRKDPSCPICGKNRTITALIDYDEFCGIGRGQETPAPGLSGEIEITARELKSLLDAPRNDFVLVDVREPHEYEICKISQAKLIPLGQLAMRAKQELSKDTKIITHCHHGIRSLKGLEILKQLGFRNVRSLKGGIDAWSTDVDPSIPRY